jgi:hypothetical protein
LFVFDVNVVSLISISNFEEKLQKDNLQQKQVPLHQEEPTLEQIPKRVHIPNKKRMKKISRQIMVTHLCGKKMQTHQDDEARYFLLL